MATFVISHGGWGGGWEWTPVARLLRAQGHEVFTPTLTGLGERAHLRLGARLSDHIEDLLAVFRFEELHDIVLCGHSYSGMVVTGVADRIPDFRPAGPPTQLVSQEGVRHDAPDHSNGTRCTVGHTRGERRLRRQD